MQDTRLRIVALAALTVGAYLSIAGALLACTWWLVFSHRRRDLPAPRTVLYLGVMVLLAGIATSLSGGDGLSYLVRIGAVLLVASYAYSHRQDGELMDLGVWLFGRRVGFDLGLTAELALQAIDVAGEDLARIRLAVAQKGSGSCLRRWVDMGTALLFAHLRRSQEVTLVLALRGYAGGGAHCPHFERGARDLPAALGAICILLLAFLEPRDIFILLQ